MLKFGQLFCIVYVKVVYHKCCVLCQVSINLLGNKYSHCSKMRIALNYDKDQFIGKLANQKSYCDPSCRAKGSMTDLIWIETQKS